MSEINIIDAINKQKEYVKFLEEKNQALIDISTKLINDKTELAEANKALLDFSLSLFYKLYHSDLTPTEKAIINAWEEGKSMSKIGKDAFASKTTVFDTLKKLKESDKYGQYSEPDLKELLKQRGII